MIITYLLILKIIALTKLNFNAKIQQLKKTQYVAKSSKYYIKNIIYNKSK
jgi:hypothetical protein